MNPKIIVGHKYKVVDVVQPDWAFLSAGDEFIVLGFSPCNTVHIDIETI